MMLVLVTCALATSEPVLGEPMSPPRDDAPTDAQVLISGDSAVEAVLQTPGQPDTPLAVTLLLPGQRGTPRSLIAPPAGGWPVGVPIVVAPVDYDGSLGTTVAFEATASSTPPPTQTGPYTWSAGPWQEEGEHTTGCCAPIREVSLELTMPTVDSWSMVEFAAVLRFEYPSERILPLDVRMATTTVRFETLQWVEEDGSVEPPCFELTHRSASGVRGVVERVCPETGSTPGPDGPTPGVPAGCSTLRVTGPVYGWLARRR